MATYAEMQEIFQDIKSDLRYDHELNGCLNCGICTATCPSAHFYDFSPREIVQLLWTENVEQIYDAMQEKIWACAQCMTCASRCPFKNSPGGLIAIMREVSIKHGMQSAKDVLRPFGRVMLKLITTGNQLSPDMIQSDHFPDWGPNIQKVEGNLKTLRKAIPVRTLQTTATSWEVSLKTSVEMYTIWEMTGVLKQLETMDENLFDVIQDFIEEKREEYEELLEERAQEKDE
ncbi:MAG TPA: 4Fe-4S dicluster domain-containing protein [Burkholderiales bacterium]|nr:4Fe-4S dicluster domain-containing protein [Burkholderiales bacterium]